jgi:hypothetical protein
MTYRIATFFTSLLLQFFDRLTLSTTKPVKLPAIEPERMAMFAEVYQNAMEHFMRHVGLTT